MSKKQTYPLELKVKVVRDYDQGLGGYKVLASKYNLSRQLEEKLAALTR